MNLIFINGTMGAGKTTVSRALKSKLAPCAFADGDNFWEMEPFVVDERTKKMVVGNIAATLSGFLESGVFANVLFCWVMHEENIVRDILSALRTKNFDFYLFTLLCEESVLEKRLKKDIDRGARSLGVLERSARRAVLYGEMLSRKIDTTFLTPDGAAEKIAAAVQGAFSMPYRITPFLSDEERRIREEVYVREQGFLQEFDEIDGRAEHLLFYKDGRPAACCRIFPAGNQKVYRIGRLAVRRELRGAGAGRFALSAAEDAIRLRGGKQAELSAQLRARGFYEACGYLPEGPVYEEEGVPHLTMRKNLCPLCR